MAKPYLLIISPASAKANNGNWRTAERWAGLLARDYRTKIAATWDGRPCDGLLALHAGRSAPAIHAYARAFPQRPLVVVLTGTDLYRDIHAEGDALHSLRLATALVLLQPSGWETLPPAFHAKTRVIRQSALPAPAPPPGRKPLTSREAEGFRVLMIGHLRPEKDPATFMRAAAAVTCPQVRMQQIGGALTSSLASLARHTQHRLPHYRWLGKLPHALARERLRQGRLLVVPSRMEGGANVIVEALAAGVPIVASDVSGNRGMLGSDYAGYFPVGDHVRLARLIDRAASEPGFYQQLQAQCRARAPLFTPAIEQAALLELMASLLRCPPPAMPASPRLPSSGVPMTPESSPVRLTAFSHGGGCGCKIAPGVLSQILKSSGGFPLPPELLVGLETADDAAVYRLNDEQALIATTDFFMPIVDDPYDFGRIAATNALSDVYAMGGTPIMALALVGMPIDKLPLEVIGKILEGGRAACAAAGIPVAGGHTIDSVEPIYGLVALGLVHPSRIKRNAGARAGDTLILGKPLGVGVLSAALKKNLLDSAGYATMVDSTIRLNTPGQALSQLPAVHALTDVTGFGLLGHLLELARGAQLTAHLEMGRIPLLEQVQQLAAQGCVTGASGRNWAGYGQDVSLEAGITPLQQALLCDPQTSGGLLVACAPEAAEDVLALFRQEGFADAAVIGRMQAGPARVEVSA